MRSKLLNAWVIAVRPRTLPLSLAGMLMGSTLAADYGKFNILVFILSGITSLLLQILSNMANDYGDSRWGADNVHRKGPDRAVQAGLISAGSMKKGIIFIIALTLLAGITLLLAAAGFDFSNPNMKYIFFIFLITGLLSIIAAILYTNGKKPYGYAGFGDIFVFIFFGPVSVLGTFYLHTFIFRWEYFLPAAACGLFSTAVLNLNNIRDIQSDQIAGKKSIPVRMGRQKAVAYHHLLLIFGFLLTLAFTTIHFKSFFQFLFLLTFPLFVKNATVVKKLEDPRQLDPYLKQLALSTLVFVLLFAAGLIIPGFF